MGMFLRFVSTSFFEEIVRLTYVACCLCGLARGDTVVTAILTRRLIGEVSGGVLGAMGICRSGLEG